MNEKPKQNVSFITLFLLLGFLAAAFFAYQYRMQRDYYHDILQQTGLPYTEAPGFKGFGSN